MKELSQPAAGGSRACPGCGRPVTGRSPLCAACLVGAAHANSSHDESPAAARNRFTESFPQLEFPDPRQSPAEFSSNGPLLLRATTHADRTPVTVQFIPSRFLEGVESVEFFRQKVSRFAALHHRNLTRILDFGEVNGGFYLISEAPEPERTAKPESLSAQEWVAPVADAMATARSFGIFLRFDPELAWKDEREIPTFVPVIDPAGDASSMRPHASVGAGSPPRLHLQPGDQVGPYTIIDKLGEGGFSEVWLAEQTDPIRRKVALKFPKAGMDTRRLLARFEAEQQTLARLDHPNIARVYDAGATDLGRPYFVMEPVAGEPITTFCEEHKLSLAECLRVFIQVCRAAHHAHQKGIIHRDLKPANILVATGSDSASTGSHGVPKIIDFGIAKAVGDPLVEKTIFTREDQLIGTPEYMSPEQAAYGNESVDSSTDVYALGAILYELLTDSPPFLRPEGISGSKGTATLRQRILEEPPIKPSRKVYGGTANQSSGGNSKGSRRIRGDLDWITLKCLEKEPARRYASAASLADDLERHLRNEPVAAGPPQFSYRLRKFVSRNRTGVLAASLVVAALIGGLGLAVSGYRSAKESAVQAREEANLKNKEVERRKEEIKKTNRVVVAIRDILKAPTSGDVSAENYTARELLDNFVASKSFAALKDDPEVELRISRTLNDAYHSLNRFEEAIRHQRRVIELQETTTGPESPQALVARGDLGNSLIMAGKYKESESFLRQLLKDSQKLWGNDHPNTPVAMMMLGGALWRQELKSKTPEAEALLRESWNLFKTRSDENSRRNTVVAGGYLGLLISSDGRHEEALKIFKELEREAIEIHGARHSRVLDLRISIAREHFALKRGAEAEKLLRDCLANAPEPEKGRAAGELGRLLRESGDLEEAESLQRLALKIQDHSFPEKHHLQAQARTDLARTLLLRGRLDEAESLFREALEINVETVGMVHNYSRDSLDGLLHTLAKQGVFRAPFRDGSALFGELAPNPENDALLRFTAFDLFNKHRALDAAVHMGRQALEISREINGMAHEWTFESARLLARVLGASGQAERTIEAFKLCREFLAVAESAPAELSSIWKENFQQEIDLLEGSAILLHAGLDSSRAWLHARLLEEADPERARDLDRLSLAYHLQVFTRLLDNPQPIPLALVSLLQRANPSAMLEESVVPRDAEWRYSTENDSSWTNGSWTAPEFADGDWKQGPAALGFGDTWQATDIGSEDLGIVAARFRRHFRVANPKVIGGLRLLLRVDDGAAVYLNGTEVLRFNLPQGARGPQTMACEAISKMREADWRAYWIDPAQLRPGDNTIAVSVHQCSPTSSDLTLGAELTAYHCRLEPEAVAGLLENFDPAPVVSWLKNQTTTEVELPEADWKRRVRCVSLTANGSWEEALPEVAQLNLDDEYFTSDQRTRCKALLLEKSGRPDAARQVLREAIPARPPTRTANHLDLTPFYNALLGENWMSNRGGYGSVRVFGNAAEDLQQIGDITFDVRGIIQLSGAGGRSGPDRSRAIDEPLLTWPNSVKGLPIGRTASHLHFLHANFGERRAGSVVGAYHVHFADGTSLEVPLRFDNEIHNYHGRSDDKAGGASSLRFEHGGGSPCGADVFTWENPKPDIAIRNIDFLPAKDGGRPFLLAITTAESNE